MVECVQLSGDDFAVLLRMIGFAGFGPAAFVFVLLFDWSSVAGLVRRRRRLRRIAAIRASKKAVMRG